MSDYNATALAAANAEGLTPSGAMAMGFTTICSLAGVDPARLPSDFIWEAVRETLALALQNQIDQQAGGVLVGAVATAILGLQGQPLLYQSACGQVRQFIAPAMLPAAVAALAAMGVNV
jgi:hypothetical protein